MSGPRAAGSREAGARTQDVVGVGIGPFNLALAALLTRAPELDAAFFDARPAFAWHPGLMLDEADVQVPFLADLVTLADPTSPFSFLSYLHTHDRLYRFYLQEQLHPGRREFESYCRWVAAQLPSCRFGVRVEQVEPDGDAWRVETDTAGTLHARAVVLGVGSAPAVPRCAAPHLGPDVLHTADWLTHREHALAARAVTVVGSGQSAAEVFADLLDNAAPHARLRWFTRSPGFYPMEYSKLGLEHFTPDYTRYFHALAPERRDALLDRQDLLYKGISADTSARIYDALYRRTVDAAELDVAYAANCELRGLAPRAGGGWRLELHEWQQDVAFADAADVVVLATGHRAADPPLPRLGELAQLDAHGRPLVDLDHRVLMRDGATPPLYVQNAELHTHGVGTPDLGLGAQRGATIVNALCTREVYRLPARAAFQTFGVPADCERLP